MCKLFKVDFQAKLTLKRINTPGNQSQRKDLTIDGDSKFLRLSFFLKVRERSLLEQAAELNSEFRIECRSLGVNSLKA